MHKALLSRFADQTALVSVDHSKMFEGLLEGLSAHPHFAKLETCSQGEIDEEFWGSGDDDWLSFLRPYNVRDGLLQIPVNGVLLNRFPYQFMQYATGYEYIQAAYNRGMDDDEVEGIALVINSPGGVVSGNFDLVDRMVVNKRKPVRAFAHEFAYSAAYSIATVGDEIVVSRTGGVGSIGVYGTHVDISKALEARGTKVTFIHYGKNKVAGNETQPLDDDTKARMQRRVDYEGEMFVSLVAENRNMQVQAVRDTDANTFTAPDAVKVGLADRIGPLDNAMADFMADIKEDGVSTMSKTNEATFNQAQVDEAVEAAKATAFAQGKAEGFAEGSKSERSRISEILGSEEGKTRPKAAMATAMKTDQSVEDAKAFLGDLPAETAQTSTEGEGGGTQANSAFMDAMNNGKQPEVGGGDGGGQELDHGAQMSALANSYGLPGLKKRS
jgi:signal peptide peptidase SppA